MNVLRNHSAKAIGLLLAITICAAYSQAATVATIYQNDPNATDASIVPSTTLPNATFTTSDIDYNIHFGGATASAFLSFFNADSRLNPTFTNQQNGFDPNASIYNSFIQFTGATYLDAGSNVFDVTHDRGVVLTIAGIGTVVNQPSSSNPPYNYVLVTAPSAGYYNFLLNYTACCGTASDLVFRVNYEPVGTPEPASMTLLGFGLFGMAVVAWRHGKSKQSPSSLKGGRVQ